MAATDLRGLGTAGGFTSIVGGTYPTVNEITVAVANNLAATHGNGTWSTATGFSTHSANDVWNVLLNSTFPNGSSGYILSKVLRRILFLVGKHS